MGYIQPLANEFHIVSFLFCSSCVSYGSDQSPPQILNSFIVKIRMPEILVLNSIDTLLLRGQSAAYLKVLEFLRIFIHFDILH